MQAKTQDAPDMLTVEVSDWADTRHLEADVPSDFSVAEMVKDMVAELDLPVNDTAAYQAHLHRTGDVLGPSERCGDVLNPRGDRVSLQPDDVTAGLR